MEIAFIFLSALCVTFFLLYRSEHYKYLKEKHERQQQFNLAELRKKRLADQYNELIYFKNEATNKQIEINKYLGLLGVDPNKVDCN